MAMKRKGATGRGRSKEARAIEAAVIAAGGTVERTGKGHMKITGPTGTAIVASDPTIEARAGLKIEI